MTARDPGPIRSATVAAWPFDVRPGEVVHNLESAREGLARAAEAGARLLLLPEKWTTSHLGKFGADLRAASDAALAKLHADAAGLGVTVIGSALGGDRELPFNEQHVLGAVGDLRPYRKRMLFSPVHEERGCAAGEGLPVVVETPAGRVACAICYDLRFPEVTRTAFHQEADLLVVPAEWPSARSAILELLTRARAAENQCWALSCNRAGAIELEGRHIEFPGVALLADPSGAVAARVEGGDLLVGEVDLHEARALRRQIPCARDLERAGLARPPG